MNPHAHPTPGLHLPQPNPAAAHPPASVPHAGGYSTAPVPLAPQPPQNHAQHAQAPLMPPQAAPMPVPVHTVSPAPPAVEMSDEQQDEEWVNKAKEIVDRNRTDPFMQSRELGELKAQYLKLRYNKDIKAGKDQA